MAIARLVDSGPPAHRVWLPPLAESPTLDLLLPATFAARAGGSGGSSPRASTAGGSGGSSPRASTAGAGFQAWDWPLRGQLATPIGVVDRPFEQRRGPRLVVSGMFESAQD